MQRLARAAASHGSLMAELAVVIAAPLLLVNLSSQSLRFSSLFVLAGYCFWRLVRARARAPYLSMNWPAALPALPGILLRSAVAWLVIFALVQWLYPERLLCLASSAPAFVAAISVAYALVSVLPQEVVFRSYAAWRLDRCGVPFLPAAFLSAAVFGWVHILYGSWLSVLLCFAAGIVFYRTYRKHRSLAAVWLEHSLFGAAIFVLGLDPLFYLGPDINQFVPACADVSAVYSREVSPPA